MCLQILFDEFLIMQSLKVFLVLCIIFPWFALFWFYMSALWDTFKGIQSTSETSAFCGEYRGVLIYSNQWQDNFPINDVFNLIADTDSQQSWFWKAALFEIMWICVLMSESEFRTEMVLIERVWLQILGEQWIKCRLGIRTLIIIEVNLASK